MDCVLDNSLGDMYQVCSQIKGVEAQRLPSIKFVTHIPQWWNLAQLHLNKRYLYRYIYLSIYLSIYLYLSISIYLSIHCYWVFKDSFLGYSRPTWNKSILKQSVACHCFCPWHHQQKCISQLKFYCRCDHVNKVWQHWRRV